jgi:hypothetical protein
VWGVSRVHDAVAVHQQGVVSLRNQGLFELPAGGQLQQLRRLAFGVAAGGVTAVRQAGRHGADGAGIAAHALHDVA